MYKLKVILPVVVFSVAASIADDLPWWKTAVLYQVYPRSFKDSDGDGIGDLKGIIEKADYFKEIGVDAIWLSPIYKSPMADMGYDISNFHDIDPIFGTMADFENLSLKMKSLGIKLLMDLVPNHSSDQHAWFKSASNKSDPHHEEYKDFYIWREASGWNGSTPLPPNNWISVFDGPAWEWNEDLQLFYLHQFRVQQPDLNYRNPKVVGNMTKLLDFWMDRGVSGFRVDAVTHLFENDTFKDQPAVPGTKGDVYHTQIHMFTEDQPETFQLVKNWTEFVRARDLQEGVERTLLLEIYDPLSTLMKYYGTGVYSMTMPFNFILMGVDQESRSHDVRDFVMDWMLQVPQGGVSSWVIGNHDNTRVSNKCGSDMVDAMNLLSGVLPGIKVTYYGEEIGMENTYVRADQVLDHSIYNRDASRTPMQWDNSPNAGFSTNKTWLPVNPNYWWLNVAAQRSAQNSHLKVFQEMTKARKDPVLQRGDLQVLTPDNDTLVVIRSYNDAYFALVMNIGSDTRTYTSQSIFTSSMLGFDMSVVVGTTNSGFNQGIVVRQGFTQLRLRPKSAVLLRSLSSSPPSSAVLTLPHHSLITIVILLIVSLHLLS